jgi:hypothetical protein
MSPPGDRIERAWDRWLRWLVALWAVASVITFPLIALLYQQNNRRLDLLEIRADRIEMKVATHEVEQEKALGGERLVRIEKKLDSIEVKLDAVTMRGGKP